MPAHLPASRRLRVPTLCVVTLAVALVPAAASAQKKEDFGQALQKLTAVLAGEGGGTLARIDGAFDELVARLSAWDARVASIETRLRATIAQSDPRAAAQIRTTLGAVFFERGRLTDALDEFSQATRQDATLSTAWVMRALTLQALAQPASARDAFVAALATAPEDAVKAYYLGRLSSPDDDPTTLLPTTSLLLKEVERLRSSREGPSLPFVDVSLFDDRTPWRYRFLPAGYGAVVVPLLASRQYDAACAALRDLIAHDPIRTDAALTSDVFAAAALDVESGRPDAALSRLASVENALGKSSEFHRLRAVAYHNASQPEAALADLETAVRIAPGNERAVVAWLTALLEQGDAVTAERAAGKAHATLRSSVAVPWIQAQIYSATGRMSDVVVALERATENRPLAGAGAMWSALGIFRAFTFDPAAGDAFRHDVELNPNRQEPHLLLGEFLRSQGNLNAAYAEFAAAVLIQPDSVRAHLNIGQMHLDTGRYSDAITSLRWVVARQPALESARYALANALQRAGYAEDAAVELEAFRRLQARAADVDRNSRRLGVLRLQAGLLEQTGNCAQAIDVHEQLIALEPADATHHVALADCLVRLGDYRRAAEALERAGALGAPPAVFRRLADIYARLGRDRERDEATRQYQVREQQLLRTEQDMLRTQSEVP
jgi:tetratricopeptide (TPR) repeat protein